MTLTDCKLDCCPLDTFVEVTKDRVPVDWAAECGNTHGSEFGSEVFGKWRH